MVEISRILSYRAFLALALGLVLGASGAGSQEGPAESFGETLDVVVVVVEVEAVVTDASGRRASGLLRAHEKARRGDKGPWSDSVTQREELDRVISAIRSTLRVVPRPVGRKVLLLLAGSWPTRVAAPEWPETRADSRPLPTGASDEARFDDLAMTVSLVDTANILGYTVYPVDVHGIRSAGGLQEESDRPYTSPYTYELFRHGTLRGVAEGTGGRALLFADRLKPLETVVADTRTYYSLGFTPRLARDGASHEIRLEVRRPGHRVL